MENKENSYGLWFHNRALLLILISVFSLLLLFASLLFIPEEEGSGAVLLRGCAVLLSLGMPSFFYLRSAAGTDAFRFGHMPAVRAIPRVLLFALGAFAMGLLFGTRAVFERAPIFLFVDQLSFTPSVLASLLAYAFGTAFLPFGLVGAYLKEDGNYGILFPIACLYAAFSFSLSGALLLLFFGLFAALLYLLYRSFLTVFLANAALILGILVSHTGMIPSFAGVPEFLPPLLFAVAALGLLFGSLDYRRLAAIWREIPPGVPKKKWVLWSLYGGAFLLVSVLLSLFI